MDIDVTDVPQQERFEGRTGDGTLAGFAEYMASEHVVVVTHTEVLPEFEGRGVGGALARGVLDRVRESGRGVVPLCPFVGSWIRRHPDYADLVVDPDSIGSGPR